MVGALHGLSWNEPCFVIAPLICNAATDLASPAAPQLPGRGEVRDPAAGVSGGWFAAARMRLRLLHTERPASSPAAAALALAASKSSAIRSNSQKVGKKGMYIPNLLETRLGKAEEPCLGAQGLPLRCQTSAVPCLTLPMGPTCSRLAPGSAGTSACRERGSGSPSPGGPHSLALPALPVLVSFTNPHPQASSVPSRPRWLLCRRRLAALLDIPGMMSTASSPASIRPSWESLQTT